MSKRFWGRTRLGSCLHVCERTPGYVSDEEEAWTLCWGSAAKPAVKALHGEMPKCSKCLKEVMGREPVEWLE